MESFLDLLSLGISSIAPLPSHIVRMMCQVKDQVGQGTMDEIENKLERTLEELVSLRPGNYYHHPSISKIFNWLVDSQRTPEEFSYVVGPMGRCELDLNGHFKNLYLGLIAAEALAVKRPVLKGPWRYAAWFVVWLNSEYRSEYNYGVPSDNLSDWIICVLGDPDLCPSPLLRLAFTNLFYNMVTIKAENGKQALNAIISLCSTLPIGDSVFIEFLFGEEANLSLYTITRVLDKFTAGGYLVELDSYLACLLKTEASNIIYDMSCSYGLNPNRYTGFQEMNAVMLFFKITSMHAKLELRKYEELQLYREQENNIEDVANALHLLVTNFKQSCQTPRLANLTAHCVMDVLELVLLVNIAGMNKRGEGFPKALHSTHKLLVVLCDKTDGCNIAVSPIGLILNQFYQDRLSNLRYKLGKYQPESNVICSLLYNCNYIE